MEEILVFEILFLIFSKPFWNANMSNFFLGLISLNEYLCDNDALLVFYLEDE